jgi:HPt (histidine-containing phosphotransfer) domain-containing protein
MEPSLGHDCTSPDVAIIAMTAHATRGFEERCLAAEMDAYLSKPADAAKLVALVESYAAGREPHLNDEALPEFDAERLRWDSEREWTAPLGDQFVLPNIVDFDAALERMDGNRSLLADMATFFLEDSPELLARIREGLESRSTEEVRRAAHSLKGLAANFGAERTVQTARAIEKAAEAGELRQAGEYLANLEQCVEELSGALQSLHV